MNAVQHQRLDCQIMVGSRIRSQLIRMKREHNWSAGEVALIASQLSQWFSQLLASPWRTWPPTSATDKLLSLADAPSVNAGGSPLFVFLSVFVFYVNSCSGTGQLSATLWCPSLTAPSWTVPKPTRSQRREAVVLFAEVHHLFTILAISMTMNIIAIILRVWLLLGGSRVPRRSNLQKRNLQLHLSLQPRLSGGMEIWEN